MKTMENSLLIFIQPKDPITFFKIIKSFKGQYFYTILGRRTKEDNKYKDFICSEDKEILGSFKLEEGIDNNHNALKDDLENFKIALNESIENKKIENIYINTTSGFGLYRVALSNYMLKEYQEYPLHSFYLSERGKYHIIENYKDNFELISKNIDINYTEEPLKNYLFKIDKKNIKYNKVELSKTKTEENTSLIINKLPEKNEHLFRLYFRDFNLLKSEIKKKVKKEIKDIKLKNDEKLGDLFERLVASLFYRNLKNIKPKKINNIHIYRNIELSSKSRPKVEIDIGILNEGGDFFNVEIKTYVLKNHTIKDLKSRIQTMKNNFGAKSKFFLILPFISNELDAIKFELETTLNINLIRNEIRTKLKNKLSGYLELNKISYTQIKDIIPDYNSKWKDFFEAFYLLDLNRDIQILGLDEMDKIVKQL